jgi:L,D-transpeptidase ErfK/SrfK
MGLIRLSSRLFLSSSSVLPHALVGLAAAALLSPAPVDASQHAPGPEAGDQRATALAAGGSDRELVLDLSRRQLLVLEQGRELRRFPVAVGRPGWETPVGRFRVIERVADPTWEHPATGQRVLPGPANPLGSRWIGFHRDCLGRAGFNGREHLVVEGCVSAGFHGTPQRETVGQAVSHGCVRLFDEHVRELFELVGLGTPVTVLP